MIARKSTIEWRRGCARQAHESRRAPLVLRVALLSCAVAWAAAFVCAQATRSASIEIDARKVENRISPLLYGQFIEHMFEGVKFGLHAELLRDRSFEEAPNVI